MNWLTKLIAGYGSPSHGAGRRVKYHGIVADAASLGVTRQHLWSVLKGQRTGRSLLARYADLKKEAK